MKKKLVDLLFLLLILYVFKTWFLLNPLSSGDWSFNFPQTLKSFTIFPYIWSWTGFVTGLGGSIAFFLGLSTYFSSTANILSNFFNIPWVLIERLVWFWPFLVISVFSSYFLFKKLFSEKFALFSSFIFLFNTYILMIIGGGQMGIAIAYSIIPLVLCSFIKLNENIKLKYSLLFGVLFGILVMFELRIAYITLVGIFLYWIIKQPENKNLKQILRPFLYTFILPGIITFLIHSFWIFPLLVFHQNPALQLGSAYNSTEAVKFFSFARLENSISLLHPNWPENIFGKVGFMKPEFLMLPILAYSSLLFVNIKHKIENREQRTYILYFAFLGLIGALLAKGANEPFGGVYLWLFNNFPGFIMFRDPTKWYTLVALSYSILIPFSVWKIYEWLKTRSKFSIFPASLKLRGASKFQINSKNKIFNLQNLFLIFVVLYLMFLIKPALLGQLNGTFKPAILPKEYASLEKFISSNNRFSRTFWVPALQRFGYYSNTHPAIPANDFLKTVDYSQILKNMKTNNFENLLQEAGVEYVIVPYDSQGEIFLKDRKYDNKSYEKTINDIRKIKWLKEVDGFGKIRIFEIPNPKDHFWSPSENLRVQYRYVNPTKYILNVQNARKGDILVFAESYDQKWIAKFQISNFKSQRYHDLFNSFKLEKGGDYSFEVYYEPQKWVDIGVAISSITLMSVLAIIIFGKIRNKW